MSYPIEKIRADFPILNREVRGKKLVYLDNGASALKPQVVIDRLSQYYSGETSNIHRSAHYLAEQGTGFYEGARETVQKFVGAALSSEIIFTRGTTESINLVASAWGNSNLKSGDEILVSEFEHHSNIVPWQQLCLRTGAVLKVIPVTDRGELDLAQYDKLLSKKTKLVAVAWGSNVLGTVIPAREIVQKAHAVGAKVLLDAAQIVSSLTCDVKKIGCDFLAFSGHKVFGPYGIGVLYASAECQEKMEPYQTGGSMIGNVTWEKTTWAEAPQKFEAGTPNISGAVALKSALDYVAKTGLDAIHEHEMDLLKYVTASLRDVAGLKIYGEAENKLAIVSFTMDGIHPSDLGALLDQQGIAIRAGHHCAQPLMRRFGVNAMARASFSIYNTRAEIDSLKSSLAKAKEFF